MRPWPTAARVYQPQIVHDIVGPDGTVVRPFQKKILHKMKVPANVLMVMRNAARNTVVVRHTYNLVDLPIKVAGKSGTAEFGTTGRAGPPALPLVVRRVRAQGHPRTVRSTGPTHSWSCWRSRTTHGRRGTSATEIVKYFLQLHFGIKKDYRLPNLLKRGNFYQSN